MGVDGIGLPVVDIAAGKRSTGALDTQRIARGMACTAMRQPLDQVGATIPFRTLRAVRLVGFTVKEQKLPTRDHKPLVEWKGKPVLARRRLHRLPRHQVSVERAVVLIADIGEVIVGECRIEMPALAIDARAHGAAEGRFRPPADPGFRIRRDIGRVDRAERRRHRKPAGEILEPAHGMAIVAIADRRQFATALDQIGIEGLRRQRIDRRHRGPPPNRKRSPRGAKNQRSQNAPDNC